MLSPQALDDALAAILDRPLWLGLLMGEGREAEYEGYRRQPIAFGPPISGAQGLRYRGNRDDVRFPPLTRDAAEPFVGWQLFQDSLSIAGTAAGELLRPLQPRAREMPFFAAGTVTIGLRG